MEDPLPRTLDHEGLSLGFLRMGRVPSERSEGGEFEASSEGSSDVVPFSVIEHELTLADTPSKVKSIDDKLAVIQELFRKERRALSNQNKLATLRIKAQRRGGELLASTVRQGRPKKRSHDETFSLPEGIDKNTSFRWQALAEIAEKTLEDYLKLQEECGEEVTTAGLQRFVEGKRDGVHYSSESEEWNTPKGIVELVLAVLGEVDLDPCSNSKKKPNVPAKKVFTKSEHGLAYEWEGKVYMNPPYGQVLAEWIEKLASEFEAGRVVEALALVPSRTDTEWFRRLHHYPRCFLFGRLKFGDQESPAPFPSMVVYLGRRIEAFVEVFRAVGDIYGLLEVGRGG